MTGNRLAIGILIVVSLTGCGERPAAEPADSSATEEATTSEHVEVPVLQPDAAYPIPSVEPPELLNYINRLAQQQPRGEDNESYRADLASMTKSRLIAAERILLTPDIDPGLFEAGIIAKLDALRTLALVDKEGLGASYDAFSQDIASSQNASLSLLGRLSRYQHAVDLFANGDADDPDVILNLTREILTHPSAGYREFLATQHAGVPLDGRGFPEKATELLNVVGNHFKQANDAKLAAEAELLLRRTSFRSKVFAAMQGGKAEVTELLKGVRDLLADKERLDLTTQDAAINAGQMLEYSGEFAAARRVFEAVKESFAGHSDKPLAEQADRSTTNALRRLNLIGKSFSVDGVHADGTPFDWADHQGKVVLVDFWATWSPPWRESLPQLKSAYSKFRDQGFEIVGVNLDQNRKLMYDFLRADRLPWPIVTDDVASGLGNPNAIRYGVEAVPFVVLVGRDGRVADIHVRGDSLAKRVGNLLQESAERRAEDPQPESQLR